ncbi:MAG: hypothetical protein LC744_08845 [Chloroflexi bacterium]|nr:hypothetical protein [Chloroflexota bacterium]
MEVEAARRPALRHLGGLAGDHDPLGARCTVDEQPDRHVALLRVRQEHLDGLADHRPAVGAERKDLGERRARLAANDPHELA